MSYYCLRIANLVPFLLIKIHLFYMQYDRIKALYQVGVRKASIITPNYTHTHTQCHFTANWIAFYIDHMVLYAYYIEIDFT